MDFLVLCPGNVKNKTDEKAQKKTWPKPRHTVDK